MQGPAGGEGADSELPAQAGVRAGHLTGPLTTV